MSENPAFESFAPLEEDFYYPMILDLKGKLRCDSVLSLHVFPPVPVPAKE